MIKFNICEVLRNARPGLMLWSDSFGYVQYKGISEDEKILVSDKINYLSFSKFGQIIGSDLYPCSLWPSRECRNWSEWGKYLFKFGDFVTNINGNVYVVKEKHLFNENANCINGNDELECYSVSGDIFKAPINEFVFASKKQETEYIEELGKIKLCYSPVKGVYPFVQTDKLNDTVCKPFDNEPDLSNSLSIEKKVLNDCDSGIELNKLEESYEEIGKKENKPVFDEFKEGGRFTKPNCRNILEMFRRLGYDVPEEKPAVETPYSHYRKWDDMVIQVNKPGIMMLITAIEEKLNNKDSTNVGKIAEIKEVVNYFKNQIDE